MTASPTYDGKTGEERFAEWLERYRTEHGEEPCEPHRQMAEEQFLSPAGRLAYETTDCPPWCDRRHDRSGNLFPVECVIHCGPYHEYSYESGVCLPSEMADSGWSWHLEAFEWPTAPGELTTVVALNGNPDGLNENVDSEGWEFVVPVSRGAAMATALLDAWEEATRNPDEDLIGWAERMVRNRKPKG